MCSSDLQRVMAFLTLTPRGDYQTIDLFLGKFAEERTMSGQRLWTRDDETDGVGLVQNATAGQLVLAKPACGAVPGLELLGFNSVPEVTPEPASHVSTTDGAEKVVISNSHVARPPRPIAAAHFARISSGPCRSSPKGPH